jgi:predicted solute-binding protein
VRRDVAASRVADLRRLMDAYTAARAWGRVHAQSVIDAALAMRPHAREFYETYFTTLKYQLSAEARTGLARFGVELANLEAVRVAR